MMLPDPKLTRAFDVLLSAGEPAFDTASTVVAHQEISHGPDASRIVLPVWTAEGQRA
ncbi:hypothetical protein GCM10022240_15610 [Microbacterium kribbense]|uniref:Uncharacterized protein n=1 Tax=Microbacterium kribbense TaxID=433645 RepID=A0ABP7GG00_9MICO